MFVSGMLAGLTIVEGASFIAGPSCALYFAQMGAQVIRFDQIGGGPDARRWPRASNGTSYYWDGLNKGKKSIALDLTRPEGRALAQRLACAGDGIFVTNFPAEGFLSWKILSARRPDLICLRVMGWSDGTQAVDYTINAACGVPLLTGPADATRPVNHVLPAWDLLAGAYGAFALLASLRARDAHGEGRELLLSLSDLAAVTLGNLGSVAETSAGGDRPRGGNDLFGAFGRDFVTADGVRLMIVAITARQWSGLLDALGIVDGVAAVEAARGVSFAADEGLRYLHRDALFPLVEAAVAARRAAELEAAFAARGVCFARYRGLGEALAAEPRMFGDASLFEMVTHPSGTYPTPRAPLRPAQNDALRAPLLGQDTDEILATLLGMSGQEIGVLHDEGIVA
jgi:2-methylfumaryl-CoA isomerase